MKNKIFALWGMVRPLIMLSVILVYGAGTLVARVDGYRVDTLAFWWGLVALLLVSASIHYTNEYADFETDALTQATLYSGGSGVLPSGIVPRSFALSAAWVSLILGLLVALGGIFASILPNLIFPLLLLGAFWGWMYSLPPLKLAWNGWGELDNALLGGMLLPLFGYVAQTGKIEMGVLLAFLPFTLFVFINLLATTWADREADSEVGKYTLATRVPIPRLQVLYLSVAIIAFTLVPLVVPKTVALAGFLAFPLVVVGAFRYTRIHSPAPTTNAMIVYLLTQMVAWYFAF